MVGIDETQYPRGWKEMSYDFKLFFVYLFGSMVLLLVTRSLAAALQVVAVAALSGILFALSVVHRKKSGWRWPGAGWKEVVKALFLVLVGVFAFGPATLQFSVWEDFLVWGAGTGGIVCFWVLSSLRFVYLSEHHFALHCGDQASRGTERLAARPQRTVSYCR